MLSKLKSKEASSSSFDIIQDGRRPDLKALLTNFVGGKPTMGKLSKEALLTSVAVLTCGPPSLTRELREMAGSINAYRINWRWHEEQFGFGAT